MSQCRESKLVLYKLFELQRRCQSFDPDSFLHGGVLRFDRDAAGQKTILVGHLLIANVHIFLW